MVIEFLPIGLEHCYGQFGLDSAAFAIAHYFEGGLQTLIGGILLQAVGRYKMKDKPFDPGRQHGIAQQGMKIKMIGKTAQRHLRITVKRHCQQMVVIHIGHDACVPAKMRPEQLNRLSEYRMIISKLIDFPMENNSFLYVFRKVVKLTSFDKIAKEIA